MKKVIGVFCVLSIIAYFQILPFAQADVKAQLRAMKPKDFPTKSIEFVVVYPAGGGMDITARMLAKHVEKYIDNRIIVVNKTGGGGMVGHTYLATQANNDGYTVGILASIIVEDDLLKAQGKWSYKDLEPLTLINKDTVTWITSTKGPFGDKSLKEIVDFARENPEKVRVSIAPQMFAQWLAENVEEASGAKFTKIPYHGGKPAIVALLGGHLDIAGYFLAEYRGLLEAGEVKVLAQGGPVRDPLFPDVPTFNEALGVDYIISQGGRYAAVPKGVPRDRFKYLEGVLEAALSDPECIQEFNKLGFKIGYTSGRETAQWLDEGYEYMKAFFVRTGRLSK